VGDYYALLELTTTNNDHVSMNIVNHVESGENYNVQIAIQRGTLITGWLDHQLQFQYTSQFGILAPLPGTLVLAGAQNGMQRFSGTIRQFTVRAEILNTTVKTSSQRLLYLLGGIAAFAAVVSAICGLAVSGAGVKRTRRSHRRSDRRSLRAAYKQAVDHVVQWGVPVGCGLLILGVGLLIVATPQNNVPLDQSGKFVVRHLPIVRNSVTNYALADEPTLFTNAEALDVGLSFSYRTPNLPVNDYPQTILITTAGASGGTTIQVLGASQMQQSNVTPFTNLWGPVVYSFPIPSNHWVAVKVSIIRNRSTTTTVDGKLVSAFTWDRPIFSSAPSQFRVTTAHNASVRNASMVVTLWRSPTALTLLWTRVAQIVGITCIFVSLLLLCRRLLSRLMPRERVDRYLVKVAFGVLGAGTVTNFLFDQLHLQFDSVDHFQRNTWLFWSYPRFSDFFQIAEIAKSLNPYGPFLGGYPPFGYIAIAPLAFVNEYVGVYTFLAALMGFLVWWFYRSFTHGFSPVVRVAIVLVALCSLPVTFGIDRANVDLLIFAFAALGIAELERNRNLSASAWIGAAAAMKIYPGIFLLRFIRKGRIRFIYAGLAFAAALTLLSLALLRGGIGSNFSAWFHTLRSVTSSSAAGPGAADFNSSFFGWAQAIGVALGGTNGGLHVQSEISGFVLPLEILMSAILACYLRWRETSAWRSTTLITILFLTVTNPSFYYELIFLFIPLALFVKHGVASSRSTVIAVLFGVILMPKAYFYVSGMLDSSVFVTFPLLVALAFFVIGDGIHERRVQVEEVRLYGEEARPRVAVGSE